MYESYICAVSGAILGIMGQNPSVSKSNRLLHSYTLLVAHLHFSSIWHSVLNGHQIDTCYDVIGLCVHTALTILGSLPYLAWSLEGSKGKRVLNGHFSLCTHIS